MTINDWDAYKASLWDWGFLDDCFGGNIRMSDLDGIVERKGNFLVLETKLPGVTLTQGQEIMFKAMQRTRLFTIMIIHGNPGYPENVTVYLRDGTQQDREDVSQKQIIEWCKQWYRRVDSNRG